jgi:hypothetical protein
MASRSPSASRPNTARRSKSAGAVPRLNLPGMWSSECLVTDPNTSRYSVDPTPRQPTAQSPIVSVDEINLIDELVIGCSAGSIRLEQYEPGTSTPRSRQPAGAVASPTSLGRRPDFGAKYLTPFALRDPVLLEFTTGMLTVRRVDGDRKPLCSCAFDAITKIVSTVTGITITGHGGFSVGLSIHDDAKSEVLLKVLHAKTRGAPPPKDVRPLTKPIKPKPRTDHSTSSHDGRRAGCHSIEPYEPTRKSAKEPLSEARTRSASTNKNGPVAGANAAPIPATPRTAARLTASQQAEQDRERRRAQLYRQLSQLQARK